MAQLTRLEFVTKWTRCFADNTIQNFDEQLFRDFQQDIADSFGLAAPAVNVPLLDPERTDYPAGFEVRQPYGDVSYNFFARAAGGPFPAPPNEAGDGNWGLIGRTTPATQLYVAWSLDYARYQLRTAPANLQPGVLYVLRGLWNGAPVPDTVEVEGGQGGFAALGTLVSAGTRQAVTVDVAAGTYSTSIGTGGGGGGGSYTDQQAAAAALAALVAGNAQHVGVQVDQVNGLPRLTVAASNIELIRLRMYATGTGNVGEGLDFRDAGTGGLYQLVNAVNVRRLTILKEAGPSTRFDDVLTTFPAAGVSLEDNTYYTYRLLAVDVTQPMSLELRLVH